MTRIHALLTMTAALFALGSPTSAQELDDLIDITVMNGWRTEQGSTMAALHITLNDGWKTYWRMPGDTGIPPEFSWQGSENLRAVQVHWPRPTVFRDGGVETIGYKGEFVLPVEFFPKDAAAPMFVSGAASVGVCREVCVPVEARFDADLDPDSKGLTDGSAPIRAALAALPDRLSGRDTVTCALDPIADGLRLTARIAVPDQGGQERVVFETGRPDIWVSTMNSHRDGVVLVASADLVPPEARPFSFDRSDLRVTVLGEGRAVEMRGCTGS